MNGKVEKLIHGNYFFIAAEDGKKYFAAFAEMPNSERRKVHNHSELTFDVSPVDDGPGKNPRACNVHVTVERPVRV